MKKLQPLGDKIIVLPVSSENHKTAGGLELVEGQLEKGKVVAFPESYKDVYKVGDTVLFQKGNYVTHFYLGETHLILNGNGAPQGDVWFIEGE